jgi:endonuclease-3
MPLDFRRVVSTLKKSYGPPAVPRDPDPFEMILRENVAYLVSDDQRERAFATLRRAAGTKPREILAAPREALYEATRLGGMHPEDRVDRLRGIAELAIQEARGDLRKLLRGPLPAARKVLRMFPSIGDPGVEKILLFTRTHASLALESNGLRVLLRLGFGEEKKGYAATYKSVQGAVGTVSPREADLLIEAHLLLRQHGKETCKRDPLCERCPLAGGCAFFARERKT